MHIFLRIRSKIYKAFVPDPLSIGTIRQLFVDVGGYRPSINDVFPDIYISNSKKKYKLTESTINDVVDGTLLTLQVEARPETTVQTRLDNKMDSSTDGISGMHRNMFYLPFSLYSAEFESENSSKIPASPHPQRANSRRASQESIANGPSIRGRTPEGYPFGHYLTKSTAGSC